MRARHAYRAAESPNAQYRDEAGESRFGVPPASIPDYLALVGDAADGFPGLPGWGAKSAAAVLARFGHLQSIPWIGMRGMSMPPIRKGSHARYIRSGTRAFLFRTLATLRTDIELFESVEQLRWKGPTPAFKPLAARLEAVK